MSVDSRRFQFGSIWVQLVPCLEITSLVGPVAGPCVPPTCLSSSICFPPGRTLAQVRHRPDDADPLPDLRRLLEALERLQIGTEILAEESQFDRLQRNLQRSSGA